MAKFADGFTFDKVYVSKTARSQPGTKRYAVDCRF